MARILVLFRKIIRENKANKRGECFRKIIFNHLRECRFCDTVNVNVQHTLLPRFYGEVRLKGRVAAREQYITQQLLREQ